MSEVITIGCKNGHIFSACVEEEAKGILWWAQVGYYAQQGCLVNSVGQGEWKFTKDDTCEECKTINHEGASLIEEEEEE